MPMWIYKGGLGFCSNLSPLEAWAVKALPVLVDLVSEANMSAGRSDQCPDVQKLVNELGALMSEQISVNDKHIETMNRAYGERSKNARLERTPVKAVSKVCAESLRLIEAMSTFQGPRKYEQATLF